jgi:hypothetical protein
MKTLSSNGDLFQYLCSLANLLSERGGEALAERVRTAARQSTSFSTEFLGEARLALEEVAVTNSQFLEADELDELRGLLAQVRAALGG